MHFKARTVLLLLISPSTEMIGVQGDIGTGRAVLMLISEDGAEEGEDDDEGTEAE